MAQELESYGIDPMAEGISDQQYSDAMEELQRRREALLAGKTPTEQRRILAMRNTMLWHLNNVSLSRLYHHTLKLNSASVGRNNQCTLASNNVSTGRLHHDAVKREEEEW